MFKHDKWAEKLSKSPLTALRRTDYVRHLKVWNEKADLVDRTFFDVALNIYRRRYNSEGTTVIFLAVSDDADWIKV